jgi:hypothetical protein
MKISPACQAAHSINSPDDINQIIVKFRQNAVVNHVDLVPLAARRGNVSGLFRGTPTGRCRMDCTRRRRSLKVFFEITDCLTHGFCGEIMKNRLSFFDSRADQ